MSIPERNELAKKSKKFRLPFHRVPVHPVCNVVVAITVVVALLRPPDLVSHDQHRNPSAQEEEAGRIFHLTITQGVHLGIISFTLVTTVPTVIVIAPIVIPLAVSFVVLVVVRHEVAKSEPVVTGDKIQARRRPSIPVQIGRALDSTGEFTQKSFVTFY